MDNIMVLGQEEKALAVVEKRTAIYLLLDASGSMWKNKEEHLGGVNGYLESMKTDSNLYTLNITLFSSRGTKVIREGNLEDAEFVTEEEYVATGGTPLLDAAWEIIGKAEVAAEKDDKVIVIMQTDGQENASVEVKLEDLKKKIEKKREDGWLFEFLGLGIDKFQGRQLGFAGPSAQSYTIEDSRAEWSLRSKTSTVYASSGQRPEDGKTKKY
jgi:uncharacterized protein YegL